VTGDTEITEKLEKARKSGAGALNLEQSPFNKCKLATSVDEAVSMAPDIGYPLVMKIVSPQVIHKTEFGGVKVGVASDDEVRQVYEEMVGRVKERIPDAQIDGVLMEEMVKGTELIIGTTKDPQFGPMIMFGVGGIFVEVYKDVTFRLIPISDNDAMNMQKELKGKAILEGVRGLPKADPQQLSDILMKISKLVHEQKDISEMDINPLMLTERGAVAVDARIILEQDQ
jgi:acyl-CoA synthetase (NDP forming)